MDGFRTDGYGYLFNCDSYLPYAIDTGRLSTYWFDIGTGYDYRNVYFDTGQNKIRSVWTDNSFNDWYMETYWYWSDYGAQPWHHFATRTTYVDNGTVRAIEDRDINAYLNPKTEYGINGKYF